MDSNTSPITAPALDIDWEYPSSALDRQTFFDLMAALRRAFPRPDYVLSADVPPWAGSGYDLQGVEPIIDYFNVMMYDCAGPWTAHGQLNSAIFPHSNNPAPYECEPGGSVKEAADIFLNQEHLPPSKLNMGTPFYGYFYTNVSALFGPCVPCDNFTVLSENYGTFIKKRIKPARLEDALRPGLAGSLHASDGWEAGLHHLRRPIFDVLPRLVFGVETRAGRRLSLVAGCGLRRPDARFARRDAPGHSGPARAGAAPLN